MPAMLARGLVGLGAAAAAFLPATAGTGPAPIDQVIAAERAFAADTRARGFKRGFLAAAAPDAIVFQPGPVNARTGLEALPDEAPPGPPLFWWPEYAGVANSGDLGFTTGGATIPVRYFTVWRRQADGRWRWIYDGGPGLEAALPERAGGAVARLAPATAAAGSPERALAEIAPLEADLARLAATDAPAAHLEYLAADGLIGGSRTATWPGRGHRAELARRPAQARLRPIGGVASRAGDMAFTYGEARWTQSERPRWGHYARIWQKRTEGWRLVVDILVPAPGAPPA